MRAAIGIVLVLVLSIVVPGGAGQSVGQRLGASDRCTKSCDAEAVNGEVPKRGNESVFLVLYGHMQDVLNRAPLNTQRPDPAKEPDRRVDLGPCMDTRTGTPADVHSKNCDIVFYGSGGLVEYQGSSWRTSQQPGLGYDVPIRGETMTAFITLSSPAITPAVSVSARLETGRFPNRGQVIAQSEDAPAARRTLVNVPGDPYDAYEFEVPMKVQLREIPADTGLGFIFTVRVSQLSHDLASGAGPVQLRVGAKFPPRLVFETESPLRSQSLDVTLMGDSTYIRWSMHSALGAYNFRDEDLRVRLDGPTSLPSEALQLVIVKRSVDHEGNFRPVNVTWKLEHTRHALADGTYRLHASIPTLDGVYLLEETRAFDVRDGEPVVQRLGEQMAAETPAPDLLLLVLAGALGCAWRRKGKAFQPPPSR